MDADSQIDIIDYAGRLWRHRLYPLLGFAVGVLIAVLYLMTSQPEYTATLKVTPAQSSPNSGTGSIGNLGGLASLAGLGSQLGKSASPFELYTETLRSDLLATELARDPAIMRTIFKREWDAGTSSWRKPDSLLFSIKNGLLISMSGRSAGWRAPDAGRLRKYFLAHIDINIQSKSPVTTITYDDTNPQFAAYVLARVHAVSDRIVRRAALRSASEYVVYLERKLATVSIAEQRTALVAMLIEQERSVMLASSGLPFAATPVEPPSATVEPTKPNPILILVGFAAVGFLLGSLAAIIDLRGLAREIRLRSVS